VLELSPGATPANLTADFDWDVGGGIIADQQSEADQQPRRGTEEPPITKQV
jgi:hypothetical protein